MSTEQKPSTGVAKVNPVTALQKSITEAKNAKELLSLPMIRERYVKLYEMASSNNDGSSKYERDLFAFMEKINDTPDLMTCDHYTIISCFIKQATWGVHPDRIYLQPQMKNGKKNMKISLDPVGKKEVLERMDTIKRVNDPVLVFNKDVFSYDPRAKRVVKHEQEDPLPKASEDTIKAVYVTVEFTNGKEQDFKLSLEELKVRRSKSKMNGGGELWTTHYGQSCKKSVINYLYNAEYKTPETNKLFPKYEDNITVDVEHREEDDTPQPETIPSTPAEQSDSFMPNVNEETGEVYETAQVVNKKEEPKDFMS